MNESFSSEEIKKYYSEWWENPKDIRNVVFNKLNKYIRKRIAAGTGKKALDVGSGHGRIVSYLVEKGYEVTAVEFNEEFVAELKEKFPSIKVVAKDIREIKLNERYDLTMCIELVQNLEREELLNLLTKLAEVTNLLQINISNRNSLHGWWVTLRGFKADFCFDYTRSEFEEILRQVGFEIVHRRGIGLVTPISLFKRFKGKLIPIWLAKLVNNLDPLFPKRCHLYYVEAINHKL